MKISAYFTYLVTWGRRTEKSHASSTESTSGSRAPNVAHRSWCINAENITLFLRGFDGPCFTFASKLMCLNCPFREYPVWKSRVMSNKVVRKFCHHQKYLSIKKKREEINPQHCIFKNLLLALISFFNYLPVGGDKMLPRAYNPEDASSMGTRMGVSLPFMVASVPPAHKSCLCPGKY